MLSDIRTVYDIAHLLAAVAIPRLRLCVYTSSRLSRGQAGCIGWAVCAGN
jgi:hypothetical protein